MDNQPQPSILMYISVDSYGCASVYVQFTVIAIRPGDVRHIKIYIMRALMNFDRVWFEF